jgi:hypothetical protein
VVPVSTRLIRLSFLASFVQDKQMAAQRSILKIGSGAQSLAAPKILPLNFFGKPPKPRKTIHEERIAERLPCTIVDFTVMIDKMDIQAQAK